MTGTRGFAALQRRYVYPPPDAAARPPLLDARPGLAGAATPLDPEAMRSAGEPTWLLGHHDFTTFRSSICQAASPVKTLDRPGRSRPRPVPLSASEYLQFRRARPQSFLHNQVRSFVGTLERVGGGRVGPG